jgi:ribose 5-phosphate isomerase B
MNIDREQIKQLVREVMKKPAATAQPSPTAPVENVIDESLKDVITEAEVRDVPVNGNLLIREDAILTPSAQDVLRERNIAITHRKRSTRAGHQRIIALGADHGGFEMKEQLRRLLSAWGYQHRDFGAYSAEAVDYPDFAHAVARSVADHVCDLGIMLDGAGIGSCMTANKVPGIRAAMCYDEATAKNSREHNYANILTLGAKMISSEQMRKIVQTWLETDEGETRHGKRVAKMMAIEKNYSR